MFVYSGVDDYSVDEDDVNDADDDDTEELTITDSDELHIKCHLKR